ncbi:5E5 antigen [Stigmatella aurantiaca DW4/3-1]|uniref:5E5 antigen n=1 Tax=Stigmatella aurantiaca (strain DW4/3-1) TaxID=378806 RepID=Q091F7_STIAD|nr:5E5 antigen [Stigmatella aurantiaca DW4/3-1]
MRHGHGGRAHEEAREIVPIDGALEGLPEVRGHPARRIGEVGGMKGGSRQGACFRQGPQRQVHLPRGPHPREAPLIRGAEQEAIQIGTALGIAEPRLEDPLAGGGGEGPQGGGAGGHRQGQCRVAQRALQVRPREGQGEFEGRSPGGELPGLAVHGKEERTVGGRGLGARDARPGPGQGVGQPERRQGDAHRLGHGPGQLAGHGEVGLAARAESAEGAGLEAQERGLHGGIRQGGISHEGGAGVGQPQLPAVGNAPRGERGRGTEDEEAGESVPERHGVPWRMRKTSPVPSRCQRPTSTSRRWSRSRSAVTTCNARPTGRVLCHSGLWARGSSPTRAWTRRVSGLGKSCGEVVSSSGFPSPSRSPSALPAPSPCMRMGGVVARG